MKSGRLHIFLGRVARNIYFWLVFNLFQIAGSLATEGLYTEKVWYSLGFNSLLSLVLAFVVYFNNLFLLPTFFEKKKYAWYFFFVSLWIVFSAKSVEFFFDYFIQNYPDFFKDTSNGFNDMPFSAALFLVAFFLFGFTMAKFANDYFLREDAVKQMEKKQVESELNFLKSQINPHFLFNTLNSIYSLALKKSDHTAEVVLKLSDLLRYILYECNTDRILLSKEIETLNNYIELERIRTKRTERILFTVNGTPGQLKVAPLIWISLVENAFKHGMGSRADDGFVNIEIDISPEQLVFKSMNNYNENKPFVSSDSSQIGGIGLENLRKRLSLIYPERHKLKIENKDGIYFVELIIKPDL